MPVSHDLKMRRAQRTREILKELYPDGKTELTYHADRPYEFLFAVIMSAQCTDKMVNRCTDVLYKKYTKLEDYLTVSLEEFTDDIKSIGLFRSKARNILATAKILAERHAGNVPATMEELIELPGVARKTANVTLHELYGIESGIAVDTHVKRLSTLLGLTDHTDPVKIERDLMELIPREEWGKFSKRLILYGRYHWTARDKDHSGPLAEVLMIP
jgi:endonuclease-3